MLQRAATRFPRLAAGYRRLTVARLGRQHDETPTGQAAGGESLDAAQTGFLADLGPLLGTRETPSVAVVPRLRGQQLDRVVRRAFPNAEVTRVPVRKSESVQHAVLAAHGPFDVIVDDSPPKGWVARFQRLFPLLAEGGVLMARSPAATAGSGPGAPPSPSTYFSGLREAAQGPVPGKFAPRWTQSRYGLGSSLGDVQQRRRHFLVTAGQGGLAKLREAETDLVMEIRANDRIRVLERRPARELTSRCTFRENIPSHNQRMRRTYTPPPLSLREYDRALCLPGQVVAQGNLLLPDTYRHNPQKWLYNRYTQELGRRFARPRADVSDPGHLAGSYFHLDCEARGHFGHTLTEQVARLWGWPAAKRAHPDLKALLSLRPGNASITEVERLIFAAAGIDEADITVLHEPMVVDTLVAATPMFSMPHYVHPDIEATWAQVGDGLAAKASAQTYPSKIFCSRRTAKRACHNADVVESAFEAAGFEVVFPEDFSFPDQVRMFREAEVVAGFGGSAMFTLAFVPSPKRVLLVSSESYTASNEYMIASVLGHAIDIVWCPADIAQPEHGYDKTAFESSFTFDVERDGAYLRDLLAST